MKTKRERAARKAGSMAEPKPPFPPQHQRAPGLESKVKPRPRYEAEAYKAAGKLKGKAALIAGGDSGIGHAVALLYAREGAGSGWADPKGISFLSYNKISRGLIVPATARRIHSGGA